MRSFLFLLTIINLSFLTLVTAIPTNNNTPNYCKNDKKVNSCIKEIEKILDKFATAFCSIYVQTPTKTKTKTVKNTVTIGKDVRTATVTAVGGTITDVRGTTVVSTVATTTSTSVTTVEITETSIVTINDVATFTVNTVTFTITPNPIITNPIPIPSLQPIANPTLTIPSIPIVDLPTVTITKRFASVLLPKTLEIPERQRLRMVKRTEKEQGGNWGGFDRKHVSSACSCIIGKVKTSTTTVTETKTRTIVKGTSVETSTVLVSVTAVATSTAVSEVTASAATTATETSAVDTETQLTTTFTDTVTNFRTLDIFQPTICTQYTAIEANPSQIYADLQTTVALDTEDEFEAIMQCAQDCFAMARALNVNSGQCRAFNVFKAGGLDNYFCTIKIASSGSAVDFSVNNFVGVSDSQIFTLDPVGCPAVITTE